MLIVITSNDIKRQHHIYMISKTEKPITEKYETLKYHLTGVRFVKRNIFTE